MSPSCDYFWFALRFYYPRFPMTENFWSVTQISHRLYWKNNKIEIKWCLFSQFILLFCNYFNKKSVFSIYIIIFMFIYCNIEVKVSLTRQKKICMGRRVQKKRSVKSVVFFEKWKNILSKMYVLLLINKYRQYLIITLYL